MSDTYQEKELGKTLFVLGIIAIAIGLYGLILLDGHSVEELEVALKLGALVGTQYTFAQSVQIFCARYAVPAIVFGCLFVIVGEYLIKGASARRRAAYADVKVAEERNAAGMRIAQASQPKIYTSRPMLNSDPSNKVATGPVVAGVAPTNTSGKKNTWVNIDGSLQYLGDEGKPVKNAWAQSLGGSSYYLGADGRIVTNSWIEHEGKWYFVKASGQQARDEWIEYKGISYYLDELGVCTAAKGG